MAPAVETVRLSPVAGHPDLFVLNGGGPTGVAGSFRCWTSISDMHRRRLEQDLRKIREDCLSVPVNLSSYYTNLMHSSRIRTSCVGDERVARLFAYVELFHLVPRQQQRIAIWWFAQAVLPILYGREWETRSVDVLRKFGQDRIRPFVVNVASRRNGKTMGMTMFLVALGFAMPGIKIPVFAAGMRSAVWVIDKALWFINGARTDEFKTRVAISNKTSISILHKPLPIGVHTNSAAARALATHVLTTHITAYPSSEEGKPRFRLVGE